MYNLIASITWTVISLTAFIVGFFQESQDAKWHYQILAVLCLILSQMHAMSKKEQ